MPSYTQMVRSVFNLEIDKFYWEFMQMMMWSLFKRQHRFPVHGHTWQIILEKMQFWRSSVPVVWGTQVWTTINLR